jgi:hypothetical protein
MMPGQRRTSVAVRTNREKSGVNEKGFNHETATLQQLQSSQAAVLRRWWTRVGIPTPKLDPDGALVCRNDFGWVYFAGFKHVRH